MASMLVMLAFSALSSTAHANFCMPWCMGHTASWRNKCSWSDGTCNLCPQCLGTLVPDCKPFCHRHPDSWSEKCSWSKGSCSACSECTPACAPWCERHPGHWMNKCGKKACSACQECQGRMEHWRDRGNMNACVKETEGTCRILSCSAKRGATECVHGKCVCTAGHCQVGGKCVPSACDDYTPGTCKVFGCSSSRGHTQCVNGKCVCAPGACAVDGVCHDTCPQDTGGTCRLFSCSNAHGATVCTGGKCLCAPGTCAMGGRCVPAHGGYGMQLDTEEALPTISADEAVPVLVTFTAALSASGLACFAAFKLVRRFQHSGELQESLLNVEETQS